MRKQPFHLPTIVNSLCQPLSRHVVCLPQIILFWNLIYVFWFDLLNNISFSGYQLDSLRRPLTTRKKRDVGNSLTAWGISLSDNSAFMSTPDIERDIFNSTTTEVPIKRFTEPVSYLALGIKLADTKLWCSCHNTIVFQLVKKNLQYTQCSIPVGGCVCL